MNLEMNKKGRNNIEITKREYNQCFINWKKNYVQWSEKCWCNHGFLKIFYGKETAVCC